MVMLVMVVMIDNEGEGVSTPLASLCIPFDDDTQLHGNVHPLTRHEK
jgi:hypothetical protein